MTLCRIRALSCVSLKAPARDLRFNSDAVTYMIDSKEGAQLMVLLIIGETSTVHTLNERHYIAKDNCIHESCSDCTYMRL